MNWYKKAQIDENTILLYRGLNQKFYKNFDLGHTDAPIGYSTWTDNPNLAREYAGPNGFVYEIELPKNEMGETFINDDGERCLFFNNKKNAGLNNISGDEYLVYHYHEKYNSNLIREFRT